MNGLPDEALPVGRVRPCCGCMTGGDVLPELLHVGDGQQSVRELAVETQGLVEAHHLHRVLEYFAVAADGWLVRRPRDRNDLQVQFRRPRPVEPKFLFAIMLALFQRAEIEEVEYDRLLDLVGVVAGEDYPGNVRFQQFDVAGGMGERVFPQQRLYEACVNRYNLCAGIVQCAPQER
jgi:hypothetical protein